MDDAWFFLYCMAAWFFGFALGNTPIGIPVFGREHSRIIAIVGATIILVAISVTLYVGREMSPGMVILAISFLLGMLSVARINGYIKNKKG